MLTGQKSEYCNLFVHVLKVKYTEVSEVSIVTFAIGQSLIDCFIREYQTCYLLLYMHPRAYTESKTCKRCLPEAKVPVYM